VPPSCLTGLTNRSAERQMEDRSPGQPASLEAPGPVGKKVVRTNYEGRASPAQLGHAGPLFLALALADETQRRIEGPARSSQVKLGATRCARLDEKSSSCLKRRISALATMAGSHSDDAAFALVHNGLF
jgi:hypothetical protein